MRIIAGERRGHKFDGPDNDVTRPTSDMVREAMFNILAERPEGRVAYDLFAGSGALGFEALSRGSAFCVFIEKDRRNLAMIRRNLATLKYQGRASIVGGDAYRWAATFTPEDDRPVLVLIDPPYRDFQEKVSRVRTMIEALVERLPVDSTIVVEFEKHSDEESIPDIGRWDVRRYGRTQLAIRDISRPEVVIEVEAEGEPS